MAQDLPALLIRKRACKSPEIEPTDSGSWPPISILVQTAKACPCRILQP
jgi:hypothetical protein